MYKASSGDEESVLDFRSGMTEDDQSYFKDPDNSEYDVISESHEGFRD